jgi:hypothetical protein
MNLKENILSADCSINDGKNVEDTTLLKAGAKDGLSGTNVTKPFEGSYSCKGPFGGEKKSY